MPEPKLTRLEIVQVLLRSADFVIEEYEDDAVITVEDVMKVLGKTYAELVKEMSD